MKKDIVEFLRENLGLMDDEMPEFLHSFMDSFKMCVDSLKAVQENPDFAEVRRVTHTLYGFSKNIGALDLFDAAFALNAAAKAGDVAGYREKIRVILELYDRYEAEAAE